MSFFLNKLFRVLPSPPHISCLRAKTDSPRLEINSFPSSIQMSTRAGDCRSSAPALALAFSSVGRGVSAGQLTSVDLRATHEKNCLKNDLRSTSNEREKSTWGRLAKIDLGSARLWIGFLAGWQWSMVLCLSQAVPT